MSDILKELAKNSQAILDEVKKSMGEEDNADAKTDPKVDPPEKTDAEKHQEEQKEALGIVNKALEAVGTFFKSGAVVKKAEEKEEDDDTGEGTEGAEKKEGDDDDEGGLGKASLDTNMLFNDDQSGDDNVVDAGPIFKSIDKNTVDINKRLAKLEKSLDTITKSIEFLAGGVSASLVAHKSLNSSVGTLMGGISEIYKIPLPFQSHVTGRSHLEGKKQDTSKGINLNIVKAQNPQEYQNLSAAINKAVQDGKLSDMQGIAMFDDNFIPAERVALIQEYAKK